MHRRTIGFELVEAVPQGSTVAVAGALGVGECRAAGRTGWISSVTDASSCMQRVNQLRGHIHLGLTLPALAVPKLSKQYMPLHAPCFFRAHLAPGKP